MQTRAIGSLQVSVVGIGCNNFGRRLPEPGAKAVIDAAIDAGINFFDTADVYGPKDSEEFIGRALGKRRSQVLIATKFGSPMEGQGTGASAKYIRVAVEASLRRLQTDVIDLYQLHQPDQSVPMAETLGALDELVKAGKVREIGCSNFSADQLREAEAAVKPGAARYVSVQNEFSLLRRGVEETEVLPECEKQGIAYLPFFPLASGLLTGKYRKGQPPPEGTRIMTTHHSRWLTDQNLAVVENLIEFAESHGHTLLELAFAWLLAHKPIASVIAGAMKPEQVQANAAATEWTLSEADMAAVDKILALPV